MNNHKQNSVTSSLPLGERMPTGQVRGCFIDTHTHIDGEEFKDDLDEVVARAKAAGAIQLLVPGINYESIASIKAVCERFPDFMRPMIGLHPEDVKEDYKEVLEKMHDILISDSSPSSDNILSPSGSLPTGEGGGRGRLYFTTNFFPFFT